MSQPSPPPTPHGDSAARFATAAEWLRRLAAENSGAAGFSTNSPSPNITPELRREIALNYVGCLDETELVDLIAAVRGEPEPADNQPVPLAERIRTAEAAGDWITAMALKNEQLRQLQNP